MESEEHSSLDCHLGNLSAIFQSHATTAGKRPVQSFAGTRATLARRRRNRARHCAGRERFAESENRRRQRLSAFAGVFVFAARQLRPEELEVEDKGENRYRRALYTFRYRTVPYPMLQTFDTPNGDISCVRRARSNTPLQALTTLNETLFLEAARALALKTLKEGGATDAQRVEFAFRRVLSRKPSTQETTELLA